MSVRNAGCSGSEVRQGLCSNMSHGETGATDGRRRQETAGDGPSAAGVRAAEIFQEPITSLLRGFAGHQTAPGRRAGTGGAQRNVSRCSDEDVVTASKWALFNAVTLLTPPFPLPATLVCSARRAS